VAFAILLLVIWFAQRQSKGSHPFKSMSAEWSLSPVWASDPPLSRPPEEGRGGLEVFLDISIPVGGFLPPASSKREVSGFRELVNQVPDQMVSVAGGTHSPVRWFGVGTGVSLFSGRPDPLRRDLFKGRETRLDLALRQILSELDRGDVNMVALISDLIATDELVGAMGAAKALSDWSQSGRVRTGELGVGLFGARVSYWGVNKGTCTTDRGLGCWFSEQAQEYRPLTRSAKKPFYVLFLGRGLDNVDRTGQALLEGARGLGLDAHWELLSGAARSRKATVECRAWKADDPGQDQFALRREQDGSFECQRGEAVELVCPFPNGTKLSSPETHTSWEAVRTKLGEDKVILTIDCERLRSTPPPSDLVVTIDGKPQGRGIDVWRKWSAETDEREEDLDRTLRLEAFVEKVWLRPDHIQMTSAPILKAHTR
jgi:hypothetical protein